MDIFVHTSRFEGFPMAVLEAAGLSKPLIISKATNFQYYIEKYNSGTVLNENNINCLSKVLLEYEQKFDANLLAIEASNARFMILEEFDWSKISKELINE
jgi:glycosyltransferase involved in cell wall biosynthesis